ncbi:aldo/keto reductase [Paracoccaceae bacterium GXU_MW_L88]
MSDIIPISQTVSLGPFEVGRLGYGCWRFAGTPVESAREKIAAAQEWPGKLLLDTAPIYGFGETGFGEAEERLGDLFAADKGLRDEVVLVTKAGIEPPAPYDSRKERLIQSAEASLRRLKTDVLDVFLIHRPDLLVSHEEVAEALTTLRDAGKVREVGVSNFTTAQTRALAAKLPFPMAATQPEFSALATDEMENGTLDLAQELNLRPMAWSPLAGGMLATGQGDHPALSRVLKVIDDIAEELGSPRDAVALAFVLAHPSEPLALVGSQTPARIAASAAALETGLTRRQWYRIYEAKRGAPMP